MSEPIVKPEWKDAPEWAKFLAQDEDGEWNWYECKPVLRNIHFRFWIPSGSTKWATAVGTEEDAHLIEDWTKTVEKRPEE